MSSKLILLFGMNMFLLLQGCATPPATVEKPHLARYRAGLANPAAARCLRDGYRLEFIYSPDGVPLQGLCVNDAMSAKCEEWAYFRGECRLDKATPPPPLPSLPSLPLEPEDMPDLPRVRRVRVGHG